MKITSKLKRENKKGNNSSCNCRNKEECPLGGKCNVENIVYQINIPRKEDKLNSKAYIGISSLNWKLSHYNNRQSFNNPLLKNQIPLSKYNGKRKEKTRVNPNNELENFEKIINSKRSYMVDVIYAEMKISL